MSSSGNGGQVNVDQHHHWEKLEELGKAMLRKLRKPWLNGGICDVHELENLLL